MEQQAQRAYGKDKVKFYDKNIKSPEVKKEKVKDKAMSRDDLNRLKETMKEARSFSRDALEISSRCGLRVDEIAHLKAEHIDLNNKTLYVSPEGAKNGRERVVPIRDKDIIYFGELKDRSPARGYLTNINAKSIDKSIRRYMNQTTDNRGESLGHKYPRETIHSIRKLYATERMRELRGNEPLADKREEMKCWDKVSQELGHGAGRENLYKTYCKG